MRILPEDERERKWFIGIVISLIVWWPLGAAFFHQRFVPHIIFGLFIGLVSKMKMRRCFYVSLKGAFVSLLIFLFEAIMVFLIYNLELKGNYIWGLSEIGYIWVLFIFLAIINSLTFSVSSLFGAVIREKILQKKS